MRELIIKMRNQKERDYSKLPEADVVVNYIVARLTQGLYSLILTVGLPGTGKSSSNIRLAELIQEALRKLGREVKITIVDSLLELVRAVRESKPEDIIITEEVSVLFPSRRAMANDNVSMGKITDTCRKKEIILIANAPIWNSIDSHIRCLGNVYIETLKINRTHKIVNCKMFRLQTNPGSGKTYFHFLKRNGKRVHRCFFRQPNKDTWEAYEGKKDKFMDELYEELEIKAEKKKAKKDKELGKQGKIVKPLTPREMQVYDCVYRNDMTYAEAGKKLGISMQRVGVIKKSIDKKVAINTKDKPINDEKDTKEALK